MLFWIYIILGTINLGLGIVSAIDVICKGSNKDIPWWDEIIAGFIIFLFPFVLLYFLWYFIWLFFMKFKKI